MKGKAAISLIGSKACTGCMGCIDSCPVDALEIEIDSEGFYKPVLTDKCVNCGVCSDHCPAIISKKAEEVTSDYPFFYGGWTKDWEVLKKSSSGGIFHSLATKILKEGGYVVAARWDGLKVIHSVCSNIDDLELYMGSKYVQSDIKGVYSQAISLLKKGHKVLFVGTPCQVSAMKSFTDDANLMTVDLVCHGVPSLKVFKYYCEYIKSKYRKKLAKIDFRSKPRGWSRYRVAFKFADDSQCSFFHGWDLFFRGFIKDVYLNEACYNCPVAHIPRPGDITLGDFWGVPVALKNRDRGCSVISANTAKGKIFLENLSKEEIIELHRVSKVEATKSNPAFIKGNRRRPEERDWLLDLLEHRDFKIFIKKLNLRTSLRKKISQVVRTSIPSSIKVKIKAILKWKR